MGALWQTESSKAAKLQGSPDPAPLPKNKPRPRYVRRLFWLIVLMALVALGFATAKEMRTSRLQAQELSRLARSLTYQVQPGPSDAMIYPGAGPFDRRLGYSELGTFLPRLLKRGYVIEAQARFSPQLMDYSAKGLFVPYAEKIQAGLSITDCRAVPLYQYKYPQQLYERFDAIPPLVVSSLLFIENRDLLDPTQPQANPAVDWPRFANAAWSQVAKVLHLPGQSAGGSTLATQLEKYRHSPDGLTVSGGEKLRQMFSAAVRAYRNGPQTLPARQNILRDYLNSVPLSAVPGHGEVHGLAEGLRVWYGADFNQVNQALVGPVNAQQGLALRQVLSLIIAQRRPSHYLAKGREELAQLTDSHLRLLAHNGVITPALLQAALAPKSVIATGCNNRRCNPSKPTKASAWPALAWPPCSTARCTTSTVSTSRPPAPCKRRCRPRSAITSSTSPSPTFARQIGLLGDRLLTPTSTAQVRYSFTLFELTPDGSRVRVQTDSTDQPFDINEGSKLELGSTAKLRVLTTYLQIITELHDKYAARAPADLKKVDVAEQDRISRWAVDYLIQTHGSNLPTCSTPPSTALTRPAPTKRFFTGGGMHHFHNFRNEDNGRSPTLRDALRESINLPFIRLMRDLVRFSTYSGAQQQRRVAQGRQ